MESARAEVFASPVHPHTDIEGYYGVLYLSSIDGVWATHLRPRRSKNREFEQITDVPALRVACSYGSMAVAAGSEGMFDHLLARFDDYLELREPRQLSSRYCTACSWASFDVVGSSGPEDAGFIAAFTKPQTSDEEESPTGLTATSRDLVGVIDSEALFPSAKGLMFGAQDVLVMASRGTLHIDGWNPYLRDEKTPNIDLQQSLFSRKTVKVGKLENQAIDGAATVFGILAEMDSALLLRGVDGSISAFGQPVNWRTFPRSRNYLNHLHVTHEDHISILAFVDDYFISENDRGPAVQRPRLSRAYRS
jgi:hypothetical protein